MNHKTHVLKRLTSYHQGQIIITPHAQFQATFRSISLDEIKENIMKPKRLVFAGLQEAQQQKDEKYDCYFAYSKTQCHRYILVFNKNCIVCTVIKINRRWQRIIEKYIKTENR